MPRPYKHQYYLNIAKQVATRSTCLDKQYGCIIVKNDIIIATGYNGSPRGCSNCCDIGTCQSEGDKQKCIAVHAEQNALIQAGRMSMEASLYLNCTDGDCIVLPCHKCKGLIRNARIKEIIVPQRAPEYGYLGNYKTAGLRWNYIGEHWCICDFETMD